MVRTFLMEQDWTQWLINEFILKLLLYILTHNWSFFNGSHYPQVQGVAMGTCCALAYTNLFLGGWERKIFANSALGEYGNYVLVWLLYIDDIFIIWTGTSQPKFAVNSHPNTITFLDLQIFKGSENCLATSLYRKETVRNTILQAHSAHQAALIRSTP